MYNLKYHTLQTNIIKNVFVISDAGKSSYEEYVKIMKNRIRLAHNYYYQQEKKNLLQNSIENELTM